MITFNMITFEDLQKANEQINTTNIKGKEYAEVNQRIKAFRMVYPTGFILTELKSNADGVCVMSAQVGYYGDENEACTLGMGTAFEAQADKSSFVNKTSYIENCETSAVGRALGMAGFGIDTSVASYEEVQNAINQQAPIDEHTVMVIETLCKETGIEVDKLLNGKFKSISDMTVADGNKAVAYLQKQRAKK